MQIAGQSIDDLKTDRKDIMPPLPMVFRLVPLLFYCAIGFVVIVGSTALWNAQVARQRIASIGDRIAVLNGEITNTKSSRASLEARIREAADLENWVLASMPLQPLVVALVRSMGPGSSIVELSIERDAETPSQLRLGLRLNSDSDKQLESTLDVIRRMHYREFSPTQTRARGDLDYRASLLWQNPYSKNQLPEEREQQSVQP